MTAQGAVGLPVAAEGGGFSAIVLSVILATQLRSVAKRG